MASLQKVQTVNDTSSPQTAQTTPDATLKKTNEPSEEGSTTLKRSQDVQHGFEDHDAIVASLLDEATIPQARDILARALLELKGEIVLFVGRQPPGPALWASGENILRLSDTSTTNAEDWTGVSLDLEQHKLVMERLVVITEELGGFVSRIPFLSGSRSRLTL